MTDIDIIENARKYGAVICEDGPDCQFEISFSGSQLISLVRHLDDVRDKIISAQAVKLARHQNMLSSAAGINSDLCYLHEQMGKKLYNFTGAVND